MQNYFYGGDEAANQIDGPGLHSEQEEENFDETDSDCIERGTNHDQQEDAQSMLIAPLK